LDEVGEVIVNGCTSVQASAVVESERMGRLAVEEVVEDKLALVVVPMRVKRIHSLP
jgi:hypothetical protein